MRSEKEMYDLILGYANADENIRAVILNGSRANPNRKPCLLYTSPSPRDRSVSRMPSSA